ncbi:helix-turn-helix domain-containing protein [Cereibacter johrii]|uniref:helix-turn-helix domain-containing protein n=1 Tax=Cereibacter johrii TaxID=445629 RepID=UPI000DCC254E|nr:hypothetical protein DDV93_13935 [Cereibacter johrii]
MNEPLLLTEAEAADYLRLSTKTLQRRRRAREISFIRDGGVKYLRSDLDAYVAARRTEATAPPSAAPKQKYRPVSAKSVSNRKALVDFI